MKNYHPKRISTSYCIVRNNTGLRNIIKLRMRTLKFTNASLAHAVSDTIKFNMDTANLHNYLTGKNPKAISQNDLINGICRVLKLRITLKIEEDDNN